MFLLGVESGTFSFSLSMISLTFVFSSLSSCFSLSCKGRNRMKEAIKRRGIQTLLGSAILVFPNQNFWFPLSFSLSLSLTFYLSIYLSLSLRIRLYECQFDTLVKFDTRDTLKGGKKWRVERRVKVDRKQSRMCEEHALVVLLEQVDQIEQKDH